MPKGLPAESPRALRLPSAHGLSRASPLGPARAAARGYLSRTPPWSANGSGRHTASRRVVHPPVYHRRHRRAGTRVVSGGYLLCRERARGYRMSPRSVKPWPTFRRAPRGRGRGPDGAITGEGVTGSRGSPLAERWTDVMDLFPMPHSSPSGREGLLVSHRSRPYAFGTPAILPLQAGIISTRHRRPDLRIHSLQVTLRRSVAASNASAHRHSTRRDPRACAVVRRTRFHAAMRGVVGHPGGLRAPDPPVMDRGAEVAEQCAREVGPDPAPLERQGTQWRRAPVFPRRGHGVHRRKAICRCARPESPSHSGEPAPATDATLRPCGRNRASSPAVGDRGAHRRHPFRTWDWGSGGLALVHPHETPGWNSSGGALRDVTTLTDVRSALARLTDETRIAFGAPPFSSDASGDRLMTNSPSSTTPRDRAR